MDTTLASLRHLWAGFLAALPRIVLALVVLGLAILAGRLVRRLLRGHPGHTDAERKQRGNLHLALGRVAMAVVIVIGALVAATIAFPNFTPADLVSALGIGGVAIGFAFKDIFQNFLAGLLILITRPFVVGDQIVFKDFEGEVENILTRATYLKTYDGRRVVIPNGDLFTNSVVVNTAFETRRMQYDIGIGYGDDIEKARKIILDTLVEIEGVLPDPQAEVIVVDLAESSVNLRARWWSKSSRIKEVLISQDKVLTAVKQRLQAAGIDLPYPTRQVLFHDQTEETDGDRRRQREGWPAGEGAVPRKRDAVRGERDASDGAPDGIPRGGSRAGISEPDRS